MKKKLSKIIFSMAAIGLQSCFNQANGLNPTALNSIQPSMINSSGINVKMKTTGYRQNGNEYVTMSYTIEGDASDDRISWGGSWKTPQYHGELSEKLTVTINTTAKTFTIEKLADFSVPIIVRLYSTPVPSVYADIEIRDRERFLGWNADSILNHPTYEVTGEVTASQFNGSVAKNGIGIDFVSAYGKGFSTTYTDALELEYKFPTLRNISFAGSKAAVYINDNVMPLIQASSVFDKFVASTEDGVEPINPFHMFARDRANNENFCDDRPQVYSIVMRYLAENVFTSSQKQSIRNANYIRIKFAFDPTFGCGHPDRIDSGNGVSIILTITMQSDVYQSYFA